MKKWTASEEKWEIAPTLMTLMVTFWVFLVLNIYSAASGPSCGTEELCWGLSVAARRPLSSCCTQAPENTVSFVALRLSCPTACGISHPPPGTEPVTPSLDGRFLTTRPPGDIFEVKELNFSSWSLGFMSFSIKDHGNFWNTFSCRNGKECHYFLRIKVIIEIALKSRCEARLIRGHMGWTSVHLEREFCWLGLDQMNRCWDVGKFWISSHWDLLWNFISNFSVWPQEHYPLSIFKPKLSNGQEKDKDYFSRSFIKSTSLVNFFY